MVCDYAYTLAMAQKTISKNVKKRVADYASTLRSSGIPITHLYLFGSRAQGKAHRESDIDLCVISPAFRHIKDPLTFLWTKREDRHVGIEPVGYTPEEFRAKHDPLAWEIHRTGISV